MLFFVVNKKNVYNLIVINKKLLLNNIKNIDK